MVIRDTSIAHTLDMLVLLPCFFAEIAERLLLLLPGESLVDESPEKKR